MSKSLGIYHELKLPINSHNYDELIVVIVGNVDSGKSSLCGILSHPLLTGCDVDIRTIPTILDDGNGLSRARVLTLQHEKTSGRTSSISYNYMLFNESIERPRIVSLVDLAGHEQYLKTTITGIISSYPEYGLVVISKNITHITQEHYSILASLEIPILFVLTKIDLHSKKTIDENINRITMMSNRFGKSLIEVVDNDSISKCINDDKLFGFVRISNKTGEGLSTIIEYIRNIKQIKKQIIDGFAVDNVFFNIAGFGIVVSGINGTTIKKGDNMFIGPTKTNTFVRVKIRSIHDDYRNLIDVLNPGIRGCLCIKLDASAKSLINLGMGCVITHNPNNIGSTKHFEAEISIFRGKSSNIKVGYNSYINIGLNRGAIKFTRIRNKNTGVDIEFINNLQPTLVDIEFMSKYTCINVNDKFVFRSHRIHGLGCITKLKDFTM